MQEEPDGEGVPMGSTICCGGGAKVIALALTWATGAPPLCFAAGGTGGNGCEMTRSSGAHAMPFVGWPCGTPISPWKFDSRSRDAKTMPTSSSHSELAQATRPPRRTRNRELEIALK